VRPPGRVAWRRWASPVAVAVVTVAAALLRVAFTPSFYFADDTQLGAVGQWYALGDRLLSGSLPILSPGSWQGGNYLAEGQWGILNPITWLIGISARLAPDVLVLSTTVKVAFLTLMALGAYHLAREFGADAMWASVAGVLAPLGGFTVYMDAPSWVTGLMTSAFLPWAWWGLKRLQRGRSPLPFFVASYLLITVGYVYGTIVLVLVLSIEGVIAVAMRRWRTLLVVVAASVWSGLWALVIYLPGVLTAPVTKRGDLSIAFAGFLSADLADYGASATPSATASVLAWFGPTTQAPLMYIAWLLPLIALAAPLTRRAWRELLPLVFLVLILFTVSIGPSDVGPLRWPLRFMPYLTIAVVVVLAVLASRQLPQAANVWSIASALAASLILALLAWVVSPASGRSIAVSTALQVITLIVLAWACVRRPERPLRNRPGTAVLLVVLGATLAMTAVQMRVFPVSPLHIYAVPAATDQLTQVLDDAQGDVMTVGDALDRRFERDSYRERLIANLWYFSPASVMNVYTVIPYSAFADDLCIEIRGRTCAETLERLFSRDPHTGEQVVDLLSVSEIVGYRATFPDPPSPMPAGWKLGSSEAMTWRIVRTEPVPAAGGVVWSGPGTVVKTIETSDTSVSFRVEAVGGDGRVVLSRLAWPGYQVRGAVSAPPLRDYLLTVDVSGVEPGDTVTVSFVVPGAGWLAASAAGAGILLAIWMFQHHGRPIRPGRRRDAHV
jgi:hypothetical protein